MEGRNKQFNKISEITVIKCNFVPGRGEREEVERLTVVDTTDTLWSCNFEICGEAKQNYTS